MDVQHALESHPSINGMCDYVGISRSGYYQREKRHNHQSPRKLRKKFIQGEIKEIWLKSLCIYGAGKITQELRSKGYKIAERTVGKMVVKNKRRVRVYGVDTSVGSREIMIRHLFQLVTELPHLLSYAVLQDEIRTLHRKKTGKIEARSGFHDDVLMSFFLQVQFQILPEYSIYQ